MSNNNLYSAPVYGNQPQQDTGTQPVQKSQQDIINELMNINVTQSKNLTEQRDIINNSFAKIKQLEEENKALKNSMQMQPAPVQEPVQSNNIPQEYLDKVASLENQIVAMQQKQKQDALIPVIEVLNKYGVGNDAVNVFNHIKQTYGVDLVNNPKVETAELILNQLYGAKEPYSAPQGGVVINSQTPNYVEQQQDAVLEQKAQEYMVALQEQLDKKYNK